MYQKRYYPPSSTTTNKHYDTTKCFCRFNKYRIKPEENTRESFERLKECITCCRTKKTCKDLLDCRQNMSEFNEKKISDISQTRSDKIRDRYKEQRNIQIKPPQQKRLRKNGSHTRIQREYSNNLASRAYEIQKQLDLNRNAPMSKYHYLMTDKYTEYQLKDVIKRSKDFYAPLKRSNNFSVDVTATPTDIDFTLGQLTRNSVELQQERNQIKNQRKISPPLYKQQNLQIPDTSKYKSALTNRTVRSHRNTIYHLGRTSKELKEEARLSKQHNKPSKVRKNIAFDETISVKSAAVSVLEDNPSDTSNVLFYLREVVKQHDTSKQKTQSITSNKPKYKYMGCFNWCKKYKNAEDDTQSAITIYSTDNKVL